MPLLKNFLFSNETEINVIFFDQLNYIDLFAVKMPWAAKRPANEQLTVFFIGPLTAQFYLLFLLGANEPLTIFEIPSSKIYVIKGS